MMPGTLRWDSLVSFQKLWPTIPAQAELRAAEVRKVPGSARSEHSRRREVRPPGEERALSFLPSSDTGTPGNSKSVGRKGLAVLRFRHKVQSDPAARDAGAT